jgi:hypothetical protein
MKKYLKSGLLKLVPYRLIRFVLKYANLNYLLFSSARRSVGRYLLDRPCDCPSLEHSLGSRIAAGFQDCNREYLERKTLLREYVLCCNDCIIEPKYGWGILRESNQLIFDSISNNSWKESYHPSFLNYTFGRNNAEQYDAVISIRMIPGGEQNYWHFFSDLLGQVVLAQRMNLDHLPFVISRNLSVQPYFQQALARSGYLRSLHWIVQDRQYIRAGSAYFMQKELNSCDQFLKVREWLEVPDSDRSKRRRVFLTRNKNRARHLTNGAEIEAVAAGYGFEIVDTDRLTLDQQVDLFGGVEFIVGIHGAGLTNIMFRKSAPLKLLEVMPGDYLQPHYYWLSRGLGHGYRCLAGGPTRGDSSFHLPAADFKVALEQFFGQ